MMFISSTTPKRPI